MFHETWQENKVVSQGDRLNKFMARVAKQLRSVRVVPIALPWCRPTDLLIYTFSYVFLLMKCLHFDNTGVYTRAEHAPLTFWTALWKLDDKTCDNGFITNVTGQIKIHEFWDVNYEKISIFHLLCIQRQTSLNWKKTLFNIKIRKKTYFAIFKQLVLNKLE